MKYSLRNFLWIAMLLACVPALAQSAVKKRTEGPWYLVVSSSPQYPSHSTYTLCETAKSARITKDAVTKTSGKITYYCRRGTEIEFGPVAPIPVCIAPRPLAETRIQTCPAPLVGTYGQVREFVAAPYPTCWTAGTTWVNTQDPIVVCAAPPVPVTSTLLSWQPPTENTDGTALTDLAGYIVTWSKSQTTLGAVTAMVNNPAATTHIVSNLSSGTWYFAVLAYNTALVQSARSAVVIKVIP